MKELELREMVERIKREVIHRLDITANDQMFRDTIETLVEEYYPHLSIKMTMDLCNTAFNEMRQLGTLQPIIDDKSVTEIMINGIDNVFIEKDGKLQRAPVTFESEEELKKIINNIVSKVNREVNESKPIVDARLKDGSRVNVVMPPISLVGPVVTIRKFPDKPMDFARLIEYGSITKEVQEFLKIAIQSKYNIFISGGTGSGKTSFLNALSTCIPHNERVITIEDSAELQIKTIDNIIRLETRNANVEGKGEITIKDLIKSSLRMRPERIIVGEVRGGEALDMLQAMNTGHDGSLSTGHANSSKDMLSRLETMVLSGVQLPLDAIRKQIASAIDIIIHLSRLRDFSRRTVEISEIVEYKNGEIVMNKLFEFVETGEDVDGRVIGQLQRTSNPMIHIEKLRQAGYKIQI